jgi:hypothetical protein
MIDGERIHGSVSIPLERDAGIHRRIPCLTSITKRFFAR